MATVRDGEGRGLTFTYAGPLVSAISDPQGRTHTLAQGGAEGRLTAVEVLGPGSPRVVYRWSFSYQGDQLAGKTEPSGRVVSYQWEPVASPRAANGDWDGRLTRAWYVDDRMGNTLREILRSGTTLTYPGGDRFVFTYSGGHLTAVTRDTGAAVYFTWDERHNLTTFRTGIDPVSLLSLAYTYAGSRISSVTATDILGNRASADFNSLNLPTEVREWDGTGDRRTQLLYDGAGNLLRLIQAAGTGVEEWTDFLYADPVAVDAPSQVTDSLGRVSTATYHAGGTPFQVRSPANPLAPPGDPDRNPSQWQVELDGDELPWRLTDPLGQVTLLTYRAETAGSSNLVVRLQHLADGSAREVTLDPDGNVVRAVDEAGGITTATYNRAGQPLAVTRAAETSEARTVTYAWDAYGNLASFDPPEGAAGRVYFEYHRYWQSFPGGPPQPSFPPQYQGQATRIRYPDGTSDTFGYNGHDELAWRYDGAGRTTTLVRDSLHRVYRVDYPATPGYPAFSVEGASTGWGGW